jgi:hypothetical protein
MTAPLTTLHQQHVVLRSLLTVLQPDEPGLLAPPLHQLDRDTVLARWPARARPRRVEFRHHRPNAGHQPVGDVSQEALRILGVMQHHGDQGSLDSLTA